MKKILLIILTFTTQVSADTIINGGYYSNTSVMWNKAGSPYVIEGPVTFSSSTLDITDAKIIIKNGSINAYNKSMVKVRDASIENQTNSYAISSFGSLIEGNNITIQSSKFIELFGSSFIVTGLQSDHSGDTDFISLYQNSNLSVSDSRIENHKGTVFNVYDANVVKINNTEFINNNQVLLLHSSGSTTVNYNDFENNKIAIESFLENINIENNYFEKDSSVIYSFKENAPSIEKNILAGPFVVEKFSKTKNVKKRDECCSNILFLPGVMGSRLYLSGVTENQLWEPNKNADVKKLYLDGLGKSILNIFTKEIIVKTNILGGLPKVDKDIYKDFVEYLHRIKKQGIIQDYNAMPYDWRMSPDYILNNGVTFKDKNIDLVQVVKDLQKSSKTKKVTIITHSNGGLVAKQLILELRRLGLEDSIDKIIFVAMPEYGTTQAITALVFGHNQSLAGGLIMRSSIARELAKNMPTAYTLLPSEKYYESHTIADKLLHETVIRNYSRINPDLLQKSKDLHNQLDNLVYSKNISTYQILGTGLNTVSDIRLDDKNIFKIIPMYYKNGDGVVQDLYSARKGIVFSVDLKDSSYGHTNLMNHEKVIAYIHGIVNPPDPNIPLVGLDYYKIIKNNSYKLLKISPSNPNNKLTEFLTPLDMELTVGMSRIKDNTNNELYFDKFSAYTTGDFREAYEKLNSNRFEEFDNGIQYLYTDAMEHFSIKPKTNNTIDIRIIESMDGEILESEYKNIEVFKDTVMRFESDNGHNTLNASLPMTGQMIELESERLKIKLSVNEAVDQIITLIKSSSIEAYLKDRYTRRVQLYGQNKDPKYLETLRKRVADSIDSISSVSYSALLKARYSKLKEDYVYLNFLLLKL